MPITNIPQTTVGQTTVGPFYGAEGLTGSYLPTVDRNSLISSDFTMPDMSTEAAANRAWIVRSVGASGESATLLNGASSAAGGRGAAYQKAFTAPASTTSVTLFARMSSFSGNKTVKLAFYDSGQNTIISSVQCAITSTPQTFTLTMAVTPGTTYFAGIVVNDLSQQAQPYVWSWGVTPTSTAGVFASDFVRLFLNSAAFAGTSLPVSWSLGHWTPVHSHMADVALVTDANQIGVECYSNDANSTVTYPHRVTMLVNQNHWTIIDNYPIGLSIGQALLPINQGAQHVIVRSPPISLTTSGCWMRAIYLPAAARTRLIDQAPAMKMVHVGDSIANGTQSSVALHASTYPASSCATAMLRRRYPGAICFDAYGARQLFDDQATIVAAARRICALNPSDIWIALGTNDYFFSNWTAAAFGTAYASYLDTLHTYAPQARVWAQTPLLRTAPAVETANSQGSTLANYRTQISTAQSTRTPWCILVDGTGGTFPQTMGLDGVHPDWNGQGVYGDAIVAQYAAQGVL